MGKLIRQKQEAGELANAGNPNFTIVPGENNSPQTLPDIGVTRKESSTQKQEAGELATQGRPINVPDGNIYQTLPDIGVTWKESSTQKQEAGELATQEDGRPISVPDGNTYQTLPDIGVTRKESSTQKQEAGELARQDNNPGSFTGVPQGNSRKPSLISELHGEAHQAEAGGRGISNSRRWQANKCT